MLVYGKYECFVMQMLYVCVLCASCGDPGMSLNYAPTLGMSLNNALG